MTINKPLPTLPTATRTRPTSACRCGCGRLTQRMFAPGHDARLKGLIIRQIRGVMTNADIAEWGGQATADAVTKAIADKALMKRWDIAIETPAVEAKKAS